MSEAVLARHWAAGPVVAIAFCLTAACAGAGKAIQSTVEPVWPDDGAAAALNLVRYTNGLRSLSPVELEAEHLRMERELASRWTSEAALRMSLLLTTPGAAFRDDERARTLLLTVEAGGLDTLPAESELASFLLTVFTGRPVSPAEYDVRSADDASGDAVTREVDALRRALVAERTRRGELEQQVRALKRIEQNLNERENAPD
jgi:hypothetical protein